jgi:glycosyltransferase involved in cell wall biosynthesis
MTGAEGLGIGILTARFPPAYHGGAELQAAGLAERLAARHRVLVFTRDAANQRVEEAWRASSIELHRRLTGPWPLRPGVDLWSGLRGLTRCRERLDVLLAYQVCIDGYLGVLARRRLGIPLAVWIRSEDELRPELSLRFRLLSRRILTAADCVIAQTPKILALTESFLSAGRCRSGDEPRLHTIGNGVELQETDSTRRRGLLFVGRLVRRKGVDVLLEALGEADGVELVVVGDGPERRRLQRRAGDLPVRFVGEQPREAVVHEMRRAQALVLPSLHGEGLPNVILEAMACGLPVVASDNGGIPEIVRDGETGLLVPSGDASALALAVRRLLADDALRERLRAGGREVAAQHDWPGVVRSVEEVLTRLAAASEAESR